MDNAQITTALTDALRQVFGENTDAGKFIDVSRIPLICKNIEGMHESLSEITTYVKNDANWKKEFDVWKSKVVAPLIQQESDRNVERKLIFRIAKYLGSIIIAMSAIFAIIHYIMIIL